MVCVDDRHINRNGIDDRRGFHSRNLIPASNYPKARLRLIRYLDGLDPLGLLHPVYVRDVDPQWEAMLREKRHTVPRIGQHHTFVGPNGL